MPAAHNATSLREDVGSTAWYHTIDLGSGVVTPGFYDTVATARRFPFPASLEGKRCLDVGTSDGFWAFEMERRGAASVTAIDIDDPADYDWPLPRPADATRPANREVGMNRAFDVAHRALGSSVERVAISVYELPGAGLGEFDFAFMGALMLHLRDPVGALSAIRQVTGGEFMSADSVSLRATVLHPREPAALLCGTGQPRWWTPNMAAHRRMVRAAGFEIVEAGGPFFMPFGAGFPKAKPLREAGLRRLGPELAFRAGLRNVGAPSAWARCRPAA
jgi:tRNA (mo5U34)-methyltransferase